MAKLALPVGAESAFRFEYWDVFGWRFTIHVYGKARDGWFVATRQDTVRLDSGWQELHKGEWPMFVDLIGRSGFWGLPETIPNPADCVVEDGDWISLSGREGDRYHEVNRFVWREPELDRLHERLRRLSGLFPDARSSIA